MNLVTITIDADTQVVVPKEPTAEMVQAGVEAGIAAHTGWCPPTYRAMLSAAPQPPHQRHQLYVDAHCIGRVPITADEAHEAFETKDWNMVELYLLRQKSYRAALSVKVIAMKVRIIQFKPTLRQRIRKLRCLFRPHDYSDFVMDSWGAQKFEFQHSCSYCGKKKQVDESYRGVVFLHHFDGELDSSTFKDSIK